MTHFATMAEENGSRKHLFEVESAINRTEEQEMPFIDTRVTVKVSDPQKEEIRTELGKLIAILNKSEAYLMVGMEDACDLWLGGRKLEKGAYVAVSLYGDAPKEAYDRLTGEICGLLQEKLGIPGNAVYITYHPVSDWGWNGKNF